MKKNNYRVNSLSVETLRECGFDWTCMPSRNVTRLNVESFLLLLTRVGAEDLILGSDPLQNKEWRKREETGDIITGKDLLWVSKDADLRVRIRIEFCYGDIPVAAYCEIERVGIGTRKNYQCKSPDVVIRVIREYQNLRHQREIMSEVANFRGQIEDIRTELRFVEDRVGRVDDKAGKALSFAKSARRAAYESSEAK